MAIQIDNRQSLLPDPEPLLTKKAIQVLDALECSDGELSIVLVDDAEMQALNLEFRGKDNATNVLSFAMADGEFGDLMPELLGDVVISTETAIREAEEWHLTPDQRMSQLLVHGILHLFGYDHEESEEEERLMEEKSTELVRLIEPEADIRHWL